MRNHYFQFEQFVVHQDKTAMKVCTDACLFGAYVASKFQKSNYKFHVLDIGAGTGLLSLMFAQKNALAQIDAVEIDKEAAEQARENFKISPWKDRLHIHNSPIQQYGLNTYDLIISNPPFFENDLKSESHQRNLALHSEALGFDDLIDAIIKHLAPNGKVAVLLPFHRSANFENHALLKDLFVEEQVSVKQTPRHPYFRSMLLLSKRRTYPKHAEIVIADTRGKYTEEFTDLLREYYLNL